MEWEDLLKIDFGVPLSEIDPTLSPVYSDYHHKINDNQYILAYSDSDVGEKIYFGFVWTASRNVAETLFTGRFETQEFIDPPPPAPLLPERSINTYRCLVEYGKKSDPEGFFERAHRLFLVHFGDYTYHFKNIFPDDEDRPVAIEVDLRPWMKGNI